MPVQWRLFADLEPHDRRRVLDRLHRRVFAAGEIVFHEGDPADTVHFVVEGRVLAQRASSAGDLLGYAVMGRGEAFGELAMLAADRRRTATARALERTVTMTLSFGDFQALCSAHPAIERLLVGLLHERVTRLTDALMEALHVPADDRVVRRLVELCGVYGSAAQRPSPVTVSITQTDLADLAGVTRPTANRVLRRLAACSAVELRRGAIVVNDASALARLVGG